MFWKPSSGVIQSSTLVEPPTQPPISSSSGNDYVCVSRARLAVKIGVPAVQGTEGAFWAHTPEESRICRPWLKSTPLIKECVQRIWKVLFSYYCTSRLTKCEQNFLHICKCIFLLRVLNRIFLINYVIKLIKYWWLNFSPGGFFQFPWSSLTHFYTFIRVHLWSHTCPWKVSQPNKRRDQEPNGHPDWAPKTLCADRKTSRGSPLGARPVREISRLLRSSDWAQVHLPRQRTETTQEQLRDQSVNDWLKPKSAMWKDLKMTASSELDR